MQTTHRVAATNDYVSDFSDSHGPFNLQETRRKPWVVTLKINNLDVDMEVDTRVSLSLISDHERTFYLLWPNELHPKLEVSSVKLFTYTREVIQILGLVAVGITNEGQSETLQLLAVAGKGPSLSLLETGWQN